MAENFFFSFFCNNSISLLIGINNTISLKFYCHYLYHYKCWYLVQYISAPQGYILLRRKCRYPWDVHVISRDIWGLLWNIWTSRQDILRPSQGYPFAVRAYLLFAKVKNTFVYFQNNCLLLKKLLLLIYGNEFVRHRFDP